MATVLLRRGAMLTVWIAVVAGLVTTAAGRDTPANVVQRFLGREEPPLVRYRAVRRLEARNERFNASGWLEACTELAPGGTFAFRILAEGGSGYIRGRVLKKALETERDAWSSGEVARSAFTLQNYQFEPLDQDDGNLVRVALKPLRKDRTLVEGTMVLTRADGELIQIDGRLARNPSFWTTRVEIHRTYGRIKGIRVPVALESAAQVRIAGRSTFAMTYQYLTVNGQDVLTSQDNRCQ